MAGKREENPAGSSNNLRGDVLRVLGVLKVATVEQIQQIAAPHLSYRHSDKPTPSKRKQARTASHTGALSDLRKHGLAENGGQIPGGDTLRNLTPMGLKAASYELGRPVGEMGNPARGAGRTGASHPMVVNEAVLALLRPKPDLAQLANEPADVLAAAQAAADAPDGLGTIASYATEVALPATGTWSNPGKGGAQADIVITAPEDGVPLLFVEIDNCHESAHELAGKVDKYRRFFQRKVKDTDGREKPMWRTRWPMQWDSDDPLPPLLFVFNQIGERNPERTIPRLAEITYHYWRGFPARGGYHTYERQIPIVATSLDLLREHGPAGRIFWRFGRGPWSRESFQPLLDAIGNPRQVAAEAEREARWKAEREAYQAEQRRLAAQKAAEREARRPVCAGCGAKFTDERWEAAEPGRWGDPRDTHPQLCDACKERAIEAQRLAEQDERERLEQKQEPPAPKAGGWLGRWRS
ncbi:replication-relaxation family protein [Streptomyces sp. NPDC013157]|uniref:replication-relaxation family protein n=1 Tax=Streptomyces sp. NPDC013157 TaxID=3364861 RepID=UPI0036B158DC